jgi:putative ATPase
MSAQPNLLTFPSKPVSLVEKYKCRQLNDFCGLAKVKVGIGEFIAAPYSAAFIFKGDSGTGKSSLAEIVAESINAELTHVRAQECSVDELRRIVSFCHYMPMSGKLSHLVLIDEADSMSKAARDFLLSPLDKLPPYTVFIFTANQIDSFEGRFLSRNMVVDFSNYGIQADAAKLLARIWETEAPGRPPLNFARIIKEASGNVRAAIKALEWEMKL